MAPKGKHRSCSLTGTRKPFSQESRALIGFKCRPDPIKDPQDHKVLLEYRVFRVTRAFRVLPAWPEPQAFKVTQVSKARQVSKAFRVPPG